MFSVSTVYGAEPEVIALAKERGLRLELAGFAWWQNYRPGYRGEIASALAAAGAEGAARSIHGPFLDLMPASADPEVALLARVRFEAALRDCEALGARRLVLHSGWYPGTYSDGAWVERSTAFWRDFMGRVPEGLDVRLENVYEDDWGLLAELVDRVEDPRLRACLDLGHVNANSSRPARAWIEGLGGRIGHAHLHNNSGSGDEHRGLLEGSLDMEEALGLLAERCPSASWNIESKTGLAESAEYLAGFCRRAGLGPEFG